MAEDKLVRPRLSSISLINAATDLFSDFAAVFSASINSDSNEIAVLCPEIETDILFIT
jgi:hypothetical protein